MYEAYAQLLRRRLRFVSRFRSDGGTAIRDLLTELESTSDSDLASALILDEQDLCGDVFNRLTDADCRTICEQTRKWAEEFASRAEAFRPITGDIERTRDLGADPHLSGVPVLIESKYGRFIYKPRSISLDACFSHLLELLSQYGLNTGLSSTRVWSYGEFGLIEYVESSEVETTLGASRFTAIGSALAIIYVLAGTDFHYENIIFANIGTYLIDLEGLLQVRIIDERRNEEEIATVLGTGILPARVTSGGAFDFDPSVIGSGRYRFDCTLETALDSFRAGFTATYSLIQREKEKILSSGVYQALQATQSRYFAANTIDYYRALSRHIYYSSANSKGSRSFLNTLRSSAGPSDPFLLHESDALGKLCIPIFLSSNSLREIRSERGQLVNVKVAMSGFENSITRIREEMSVSDLNRQRWFIGCAFEFHALNNEHLLDLKANLDLVEANVDEAQRAILSLTERLTEFVKYGRNSEVFTVVPRREGEQWNFWNKRLTPDEAMMLDTILECALHTARIGRGAPSAMLRSLEMRLIDVIKFLNVIATKEHDELGSKLEMSERSSFLISSEEGPCKIIYDMCLQQSGLSAAQGKWFLETLASSSKEGILYGGIFRTECLFFSFGVPCLIVSLCISVIGISKENRSLQH